MPIDQERGWRVWLWRLMALGSLAVHGLTALLRLDTFWPYPKLQDFAAFYAGAVALRQGLSPYALTPELVALLRTGPPGGHGVSVPLVPYVYPPLWGQLIAPLTRLRFPLAAGIWLILLLGAAAAAFSILRRIAGLTGRRETALAALVFITFGPTALTLTLGQSALFLLLAMTLLGQASSARSFCCWRWPCRGNRPSFCCWRWPCWGRHRARSWGLDLATGLTLMVSFASKLFPLGWLAALPFARGWRTLLSCLILIALALGLSHLATPRLSRNYWREQLPARVASFTGEVALDDQSLPAYLTRLATPQSYQVPGLAVYQRTEVVWRPPWRIGAGVVRGVSYALLLLLGALTGWTMVRKGSAEGTACLFLWVTYLLLAVPHMARYEHVLLLPGMAWLWGRARRRAVLICYALSAAARLTHLWALALPAGLGMLLSGAGTVAVLWLLGAMLRELWGLDQIHHD